MEIRYLRSACGVNRMDDENDKDVYGRCGILLFIKGNGLICGIMKMAKYSTLRWFGEDYAEDV